MKLIAVPAYYLEDGVEPATVDGLHDVIMPPLMLADAEDGHDVRMMQPAGRPRLAAEPRHVAVFGEELQGDMAVERSLITFVDDAHAAPAELADDPEIAPLPAGSGGGLGMTLLAGLCGVAPGLRLGLGHSPQIGEDRIAQAIELADPFLAPATPVQVLSDVAELAIGEVAQRERAERFPGGAVHEGHRAVPERQTGRR